MVKAQFIINQLIPLPDEILKKYNIIELPSPLIIDGTEYRDNNLPYSLDEFTEILMSDKTKMDTAPNPPSDYKDIFDTIDPEIPIFVICLSMKIGAFYKSALSIQGEYQDRDITVIDTLFCPPGMTMLTLAAGQAALEAESVDQLKEEITAIRDRIKLFWGLFSLKYLYQTGRISATKAFIGQMLKIVPMITTDSDGIIIPAGKTRHISKSLDRIVSFMENDIQEKKGDAIDILVSYTGSEENGLMLKEKLESSFTVKNTHFFKGSYCVHRYVGPNAAGVGYYVHP
jgi:DegV family protein with EDD domain